MTLIYFLLVLGITIFIHELGHFIFAKKAKIHIYEFALGMGPKLFKFNRKNDETVYSIRMLPIGGFVSMAGEEIEDDRSVPDEKKFFAKSWSARFFTIIAGVLFNFLLAVFILFVIGLIAGSPINKPYINSLIEDFPITQTNLRKGDLIVKINDTKIRSIDRLLLELQLQSGKTIKMEVVDKNNNTKVVTIEPKKVVEDEKEVYKYGFTLDSTIEKGVFPAVKYAFVKTFNLIEQMGIVLTSLITGELSLKNLAGPVGIYNIVGQTAAAGFINVIYLIALISINVGFINLLPIPAFDGGRLLFLIIEKIKGSKVEPKLENTIHMIGFVLLLILMVVITYNDVVRLFT